MKKPRKGDLALRARADLLRQSEYRLRNGVRRLRHVLLSPLEIFSVLGELGRLRIVEEGRGNKK